MYGARTPRLQLQPGEMYRISYAVGGAQQRRLTRSVCRFTGQAEKRQWDGETVLCLEFARPHGRGLSLLATQLVEVRPASINELGQVVLGDPPMQHRRRPIRRRFPVSAAAQAAPSSTSS